MAIEYIELSISDIESTSAFKNADETTQNIYRTDLYVHGVAGWVTVAKYKGLEDMLNVYHMNDFKRALVKELFTLKVENLNKKK